MFALKHRRNGRSLANTDTAPHLSIKKLKRQRKTLLAAYRKNNPGMYRQGKESLDRLVLVKKFLYFTQYQHIRGIGRWRNPKRYPQQSFRWGQQNVGK